MKKLVIATRVSDLALWQAYHVKERIEELISIMKLPTCIATEFFNKLHAMLKKHSIRCFLVAIKRFRSSCNPNPLTFALDGISVALDLPIRSDTNAQLSELDELVAHFGGRVNLVKDARLSQESFVQMYPRASEWLEVKHRVDPNRLLRSKLSSRLGLT